jgi:hypothetical protein
MLLRLLTMGLCTAMVVTLATWHPVQIEVRSPSMAPPAQARPQPPPSGVPMRVVDVASGVAPIDLAALLRLASDERIMAVNDRTVDRELGLDDDMLIGSLAPRAGQFVDLTVASVRGERRVLVLVH